MRNNQFKFYSNVGAIAKHLEELENWQELTRYEITEHFMDKPVKNYNFINLRADVEDGQVFFYDVEGTIYEVNSVLIGFLEESVQSAYFSLPIKGQVEIRIILDTGYVDIMAYCDYEIEEEYACSTVDFDSPEVEEMYRAYYEQPDAYDL